MKTLRLLILFSIVSFFTLSFCSKKSDDVTPSQTQDATVGFRVKIDGLDSKTSDVVVIALPNTYAEGTYPINKTNIGMLSFNNNNDEFSTVNGGDGTVTITKKTATYMTGTFSFTAYDATGATKRTLTSGYFNVNIR